MMEVIIVSIGSALLVIVGWIKADTSKTRKAVEKINSVPCQQDALGCPARKQLLRKAR